MAWLGLAWLGLAWLGLAWLGLAWLGFKEADFLEQSGEAYDQVLSLQFELKQHQPFEAL